jgi:hypothetical protein
MTVLSHIPESSDELATLRADWEDLAGRVTAWRPSVVLLIARKSPRLRQAFDLSLSPSARVLTDLAVAFSGRQLVGARVAIVDDVINVGSTVNNVASRLKVAGVAEIRVFAVAEVDRPNILGDLEVELVSESRLDQRALQIFAGRVPEALQELARPYDLDFPILPCQLQFPLDSFEDLYDALADRHGEERVWNLSTDRGSIQGVKRLTVDLPGADGAHRKLRVYFDERSRIANIVPMAIADELPTVAPSSQWKAADVLWATLSPAVPAEDLDALARLRLYIDSLAVGARFVLDHADLLVPVERSLFSPEEAELVLGPQARVAARRVSDTDVFCQETAPDLEPLSCRVSPFADHARETGFVNAVTGAAAGADPLSVFLAVFDVLADMVGAADPDRYAWDWPYSAEEIRADPYRRLRVGPTLSDLCEIMRAAGGWSGSMAATRHTVTRLLDIYIDAGAVVPTIAEYGGKPYRIYRKGEKDGRVDFAEKVEWAVLAYEKDISRTRVAKVITTLSFAKTADPLLEVQALPRGNVLCFSNELFDEAADVTAWMRDTGRSIRNESVAGE